ncbi:MAG: TldD/PmbA family protein [Candidatus Sulfotelmatobacter sp.]
MLVVLFLAMGVPFVFAQQNGAASEDPLLQAMSAELKRSKESLKLDQVAAPYYIEYRVFDVDEYDAEAAYGSLRTNVRTRFRFLRVVVRIGDYKQDSYYGPQGQGAISIEPLDDDLIAMRHQIWEATDRAYKAAAQEFTAKQAQLKQYTAPDQPVDDFAHAEPEQSIGALVNLDFAAKPWLAMLQQGSSVYKDDPLLQSADTSLKFQAVNRYFVNSEGSVVRDGYNLYEMRINEGTQAADGMKLERSHAYTVESMKDLPSAAEFYGEANKLMGTLKLLRDAPLADEEYRGPVLFSADAASDVFSDLVGEHILGRRPELGKTARTTGEFASSYKTRVLPDFLSVVDDPTVDSFQGQHLIGNYAFDDEGVKAQRVSVIEKGKLVNYLVGREPIRDFPASNGHGRARVPTNPPGPSLGNLIVTASESFTPVELKKKLIELCQQRDLPYCYYAETLGPQRVPRLLYKVWVKDGREELVRGGSFGDLDARAMCNDLIAAGSDFNVDTQALNVPHSIVSPSFLFDELEVKRVTTNKDKLPDYPAPPLVAGK